MTSQVQNDLVALLSDTHSATREMLTSAELETRVYGEDGWRIRDIIGHIATWDRQVTRSLNAFNEGGQYTIPNLDEDSFNQQQVLEGRKMTDQEVLKEWEQAREDFIKAVREISIDRFPGDVLYPWGDERGSIATLVEYMTDHDLEHLEEIAQAKKSIE